MKDKSKMITETLEKLITMRGCNWNQLQEQMMEIMCEKNNRKYVAYLKKSGKFFDQARAGYGMEMKVKCVWVD